MREFQTIDEYGNYINPKEDLSEKQSILIAGIFVIVFFGSIIGFAILMVYDETKDVRCLNPIAEDYCSRNNYRSFVINDDEEGFTCINRDRFNVTDKSFGFTDMELKRCKVIK